ncbi:copper resistance protein NlpE N-terminal domain-containing protein [Cytophagales bacterium LB-30]|uniref:Copper resistance protein NlpE N-terminal domain-containing protein n=1 Tax=Shiella aurantiaca TaxID=3058365 RepID=A0ABT8F6C3_9BACT|nr:copper resistance protein NlpE N-terminal domain-containing protein [Shiella aurantiaca]MDN4165858.1 copper resistance protein NlpE N-terminal domain-containing protein [Shiella aurantiaca]
MKVLYFFLLIGMLAACKSSQKKESASAEAIIPDAAHNSQNALDWAGLYLGTLPCADCQGIETELRLFPNLQYELSTRYVGKSDKDFFQKGKFEWSADGRNISLLQPDGQLLQRYQVGENALFHLDTEGKRIQGELANRYVLSKAPQDAQLEEKYWKLIELNGKPISVSEKQAREAYLILKKESGRMIGRTGCNALNGTYQLQSGNRLKFSRTAMTQMACEHVPYETAFLQALERTDNYAVKGDTLSLHKARMAPLAKFVVVYLD